MQATHRWAELALGFVCLIWGSTFVLVKNALADISPSLFLGIRFSIAAVVLAILYVARSQTARSAPLRSRPGPDSGPRALASGSIKSRGQRLWIGGFATGLFLYAGYLLQTLGLRHTTPAKSGFLTGLYIVLVPLLVAVVYQKAPGVSEWVGVLLATAGMGLMTLTTARLEIGFGDTLTIACAFAFAVHILFLSHYSKRMETEWLALLQVATCSAVALATCPLLEAPFVRWTPGVLWALGITSVLATALAFLLQTWGQKHTTATRAALIFSLEPVFAWLTSYVFDHEVLTSQTAAGAGCILAGILLVELKPLGRRSALDLPNSSGF